jgi:hypothetical protein
MPGGFGSFFFGTSFGWLDSPMYRAHDLHMSMRLVDAYELVISSGAIFLSKAKPMDSRRTIG